MHHRIFAAAFCLFTPVSIQAQEFLGADAVIKRLEEASASAPEKKEATPVDKLKDRLEVFRKDAAKLAPDNAAKEWLALFDEFASMSNEVLYASRTENERLSVPLLIQALPPSNTWPELAAAIAQRKKPDQKLTNGALQFLMAVLIQDGKARDTALAALRKNIEADADMESYERQSMLENIEQISETLLALTGTSEEKIAAFEKKLVAAEKDQALSENERRFYSLEIPDLVKLVGEVKAVPLVNRAIVLEVELNADGDATRRLIARQALKNVAKLKKALWQFVETEADVPLYEALVKRFTKRSDMENRDDADTVYLMHLIAAGRTHDAVKFVLDAYATMKDKQFTFHSELIKAGLGGKVLAFMKEMLSRDPSLPFWSDYIDLAAQENASVEALEFIKGIIGNEKLDGLSRAIVWNHYYQALLAADNVEEGVAVLRDLIKAGPQGRIGDGSQASAYVKERWAQLGVTLSDEMLLQYQKGAAGRKESGNIEHVELSLKLASLGRILKRDELIAEGMAAAKSTYAKIPDTDYMSSVKLIKIVAAMMEQGKAAEAEAWLVDGLTAAVKPNPGKNRNDRSRIVDMLSELSWVYLKSGREADVVKLLDQSPLWGQTDLAALATSNTHGIPLLLVAAEALSKTGRTDEARKLAQRAVQDFSGEDAAYALLLSLGDPTLEARLDTLAKRDRFQERPLIWKAKLQMDSGRVEEAEKTIRAAIAIDPSDGEQGKGDRMRAYAVLADILERKGDNEQAKVMRGAVSAIRISEDSDDLWSAGLLSRAVKGYETALSHFADAYCIQSRLALRYSELGDFAKAEMHYRRAFELMPDSFGRIESHCFGCERAFGGKRAQSIADRVFTDLAVKLPDRPQVFYLLGYLREEEERYEEAAENYRKAVKLDPDYLNAWKRLNSTQAQIESDPVERDSIQLAILRLDPFGTHAPIDLDGVSDLGKFWDVLVQTEEALPERESGPVYPLAASAALLQKSPNPYGGSRSTFFDKRENLRDKFVQNPIIQYAASFLETVTRKQ